MDQSSLKSNLPNFNNNGTSNIQNDDNENNHFSYNPKYQNMQQQGEPNRGSSLEYDRNSNEHSNLEYSANQNYSNNSSAVKNKNYYQEEKKDINNYGDSKSFNRNDSNKEGTFGKSVIGGLGAYEKSNMQNEMNDDSMNYNDNYDAEKGSKKDLRYLQETQSSRNLKRISGGNDRNMQIPKKSLEEIEEDQTKKKNAAEKCFSLFENGKIKNEVNRLLAEKNQKIKQEMELKECTFFPKTNFNERFTGDKNTNNQMSKKLESNFYDRITNWQQKKEKK
jgi:hypothetical protein